MAQAIKERPILFSGPMVRALLAGAKTQTRRAIKGIEIKDGVLPGTVTFTRDVKAGYAYGQNVAPADLNWPFLGIAQFCPYGKPGDRLWVRETFGYNHAAAESKDILVYRADYTDGQLVTWPRREQKRSYQRGGYKQEYTEDANHWYPSIFMPRSVSRLLLEITVVRVERLQSISGADAIAEGIEKSDYGYRNYGPSNSWIAGNYAPELSYYSLWDSINGADTHSDNPWVWVVEFKVLAPTPFPIEKTTPTL